MGVEPTPQAKHHLDGGKARCSVVSPEQIYCWGLGPKTAKQLLWRYFGISRRQIIWFYGFPIEYTEISGFITADLFL